MRNIAGLLFALIVSLPFSSYAANCTETKLEKLIEEGNEEATITFIRSGDASINELGCSRPLIRAILHQNINIFKALIEAKADPDLRGYFDSKYYYDHTPLFFAADWGKSEFLKVLIEAGAKLDLQNGLRGETALMMAVQRNKMEKVRLLIEAGANLEIRNHFTGDTALIDALWLDCNNINFEILKILINSGANLYRPNDDGITTLMAASRWCSNPEVVKLIIEKTGEDVELLVNDIEKDGKTALSMTENVDIARLLLQAGANVNKGLPLFPAIREKNIEMVELLLQAGGSVDLANDDNETPLNAAAYQWNVEIVKLLIAAGANVNHMSRKEHTPFSSAIRNLSYGGENEGCLEIAKLLLANGADVRLGKSKLAILSAVQYNHFELVELFIKAGANLEVRDSSERTPLIGAVWLGGMVSPNLIGIVKALVNAGANLNAKDKHGMTALEYAVKALKNHPEWSVIVGILVDAGAKVEN